MVFPAQSHAATLDGWLSEAEGLVSRITETISDIYSLAGEVLGVSVVGSSPNQFKIIWQLSTQIEPIADAKDDSARMKQLESLKEKVDGYNIVSLSGNSLFTYWPGRPYKCAFNNKFDEDFLELEYDDSDYVSGSDQPLTFDLAEFKNKKELVKTIDIKTLESKCRQARNAYMNKRFEEKKDYYKSIGVTRKTFEDYLHAQALQRVIKNLDLKGEQRKGKIVNNNMNFSSKAFSYSSSTDTVSIPLEDGKPHYSNGYQALLDAGIVSKGPSMIYEEPSIQKRTGTSLYVPMTPGGTNYRPLPENTRILTLVGHAFEKTGVPAPDLMLNIRKWNATTSPRMIEAAMKSPYFGGVNFEGGTRNFVRVYKNGQTKFENNAQGVAWMLKNTTTNIHLLMPAYWELEQVATIKGQNTLPVRVADFVRKLNAEINRINGAPDTARPVCDPRLRFVAASYGFPFAPRQFPLKEGGEYASTVSAEIVALNNVRKELCDAQPNPPK